MDDEKLLLECDTYEDYLDSFIQPNDLYYLRDLSMARRIVALGYRSDVELLTREQFEDKKCELLDTSTTTWRPYMLFSYNCRSIDLMLIELAERERPNRLGMISTIISLRHRQSNGVEISWFIDFEESLRKSISDEEDGTDWIAIFKETKRLRPKKTDLGYYNWRTGFSIVNDSINFKAITDPVLGLIFECRHDRQQLMIDPSGHAGSGSTRTVVKSKYYDHVVLFDHVIRNKI